MCYVINNKIFSKYFSYKVSMLRFPSRVVEGHCRRKRLTVIASEEVLVVAVWGHPAEPVHSYGSEHDPSVTHLAALTGDNFPAVLSTWTQRPPHGRYTVPVRQRVTYGAGSPFVSHHAACVCSQGPRESSQSHHSLCNSWCNLHASRPSASTGTHISITCPHYQFLITCFPTCTPEGCLLFTQQLQICSGLTELLNFSVIWYLFL